jgi:hypothetical protein
MHSILQLVGRKIADLKKSVSEKTLQSLFDVNSQTPQNLGVLQYNSLSGLWSAQPPEIIEAALDGGHADTIHLDILEIDGGGA